jgi:MIP family channel proteins
MYERDFDYNNNNMLKTFAAETFGTFMFIFLSLSNIAIYSLYPEAKMTWSGVATSWGFNLLFGIIVAKKYSNAYLNPCVAFVMCLFNKSINLSELVLYTVAELLGAFLGALVTYGLYYSQYSKVEGTAICGLFATYKNSSISDTSAFFTEFVGTALLVGGIVLITSKDNKHNMFCISGLLSLVVLTLGYQTAFSLNWARDFGPRLFVTMVNSDCFNHMEYFWIPLVADYTGAVFGTLVAKLLV